SGRDRPDRLLVPRDRARRDRGHPAGHAAAQPVAGRRRPPAHVDRRDRDGGSPRGDPRASRLPDRRARRSRPRRRARRPRDRLGRGRRLRGVLRGAPVPRAHPVCRHGAVLARRRPAQRRRDRPDVLGVLEPAVHHLRRPGRNLLRHRCPAVGLDRGTGRGSCGPRPGPAGRPAARRPVIPSARRTQDQLRPEREGDRAGLRWAGEGDGAPSSRNGAEPVVANERPTGDVLRIWIPLPLAVAVGVVAVVAVAVLISQSVPGAVFVLGLFMVAPGFALVRLLMLRDRALGGCLPTARGLARAGILSTIQAYVGAGSPAATVGLLLAITIGALVARPLLALARRVQPRLASRVRSASAAGAPARSPVLVATPGVPAMRPGAAPLLSKIATTRYGDAAGSAAPVGVMAQSAAGAPASMIGGRPPHAFELDHSAAQ